MYAKLPKKWLVYRLSALGDVVLITGVLDYWHARYGWRFVVVTRAPWVSVFEGHPAVDKVIGLESAELKMPKMLGVFATLAKTYAGLGLMDLHGTLRSRILSLLWPWRGKICHYPKFSMERRAFLRASSASAKDQYSATLLQWNVTQRYVMAVRKLLSKLAGAPKVVRADKGLAHEIAVPSRQELLPKIYLSAQEKQKAKQFLQITGFTTNKPIVALHPYSTHAHKAWLPAYWQDLAKRLHEAGIAFFIVGRGNEVLSLDSLHALSGDGFDKAPYADFSNVTSLRETSALLGEADLLVTGDSGPMHLASAVGTPVVALFGPTTREWGFFPEGEKDIVLEVQELLAHGAKPSCMNSAAYACGDVGHNPQPKEGLTTPCRPCSLHGSKACTQGGACMKGISPDMVIAAVQSILEKK